MADKDPLVSAWFGVEFQGQVVGAFRECTGLGSENEVVEYKASGQKGEFIINKVPGRLKWNNITLKRGITDSMDMWKWRKLVEQAKGLLQVNQGITEAAAYEHLRRLSRQRRITLTALAEEVVRGLSTRNGLSGQSSTGKAG